MIIRWAGCTSITFVLKENLIALKNELKVWNKEKFGILEKRQAQIGKDMSELEKKENNMSLCEEEIRRKI